MAQTPHPTIALEELQRRITRRLEAMGHHGPLVLDAALFETCTAIMKEILDEDLAASIGGPPVSRET